MTRLGLRTLLALGVIAFASSVPWAPVYAAQIDSAGDIKLGVRAYTSVRIGSEETDDNSLGTETDAAGVPVPGTFGPATETFPHSAAGHVRQHRYFIEAEWDHDLRRLVDEGFGPFDLLNRLPFKLSRFKYHIVYRGEGEGIYDYGPREFRTADRFYDLRTTNLMTLQSVPLASLVYLNPDGTRTRSVHDGKEIKTGAEVIGSARRKLRRDGVERQRLFQAFVDAQVGELFLRFGRQILSWGETDNFRVLDNINPTDSSFGGFLVSLDERRVPLDMLRANYFIGQVGPLAETFIEGYAAIDNRWGGFPGIPQGSPWQLPNLGAPSPQINTLNSPRARTVENTRGGAQIKFNAPIPAIGSATFGLAHYYTFFDTPALEFITSTPDCTANLNDPTCPRLFPGIVGRPELLFSDGAAVHPTQSAQRVQVTGASSTFVIPSQWARRMFLGGEPVIRAEFAYFNNEPRFRQSELDPFYFNVVEGRQRSHRRTGDSVNFVFGTDMNQFIRFLNPRTSFFFSHQFFFRHLNGATKRGPISLPGMTCDPRTGDGCYSYTVSDPRIDPMEDQTPMIFDGEILPVPAETLPTTGQPIYIKHPTNQYLQTLFISTAYFSGQVIPSLTLFYDWSGSFVSIPAVTFSRDPFRVSVQYNFLTSGSLRGASGTSLLRDRDNFLLQFEYVL